MPNVGSAANNKIDFTVQRHEICPYMYVEYNCSTCLFEIDALQKFFNSRMNPTGRSIFYSGEMLRLTKEYNVIFRVATDTNLPNVTTSYFETPGNYVVTKHI